MKVVAIRDGYYNHRRVYKGEAFEIKDEAAFSEKWMKKPGDPDPKPAAPAVPPQAEKPVVPGAPIEDDGDGGAVI